MDIQYQVDAALGKGRSTSSGNRSYICPFCKHRKYKLEVNLSTGQWHCWVCDTKGKTFNTLFRRLKIDVRIATPKQSGIVSVIQSNVPKLPIEYKPLWIPNSELEYTAALRYVLNDRKIAQYDIIRYKIGYCTTGPYRRMIIIPSYDAKGELNYFVARSYINQFFSKPKKDDMDPNIIPFEYYINWNEPVTLTESSFNAITTGRNAIPLSGKNIPQVLMNKISTSPCQYVNLAFDGDAGSRTITVAESLISIGKIPRYIRIEELDPNDLGYAEMKKRSAAAQPMNELDIMKNKLMMI